MDVDYEKLARAYLKMRAAKAEKTKEAEAIGDQMKILEAHMLHVLNTNKINSTRTNAGTIYKEEKITPTGSDWEAFYRWITENDAFDFLERRIKATSVKEYMEAHEGGVPPGVSVFREFVARVRTK